MLKRIAMTVIMLVAILFGVAVQAADSTTTGNVNIGAVYDTDAEAFGFSVQAMRKLSGGRLQFSAIGSFGEAANKASIESGLFIMEGGLIEAAIIQGVNETWDGSTAYTAGYSGLFGTFRSPWNWPGYDKPIKFFAKWQRQYPLDKFGAQEASHEFTFGVSL